MTISEISNISIAGLVSAVPDTAEQKSVKEQTASDLAFEAATKLLSESKSYKEQIGIILFLSTTPDYRSPATAMVLQNRLDIQTNCIAFDINSGGGGFLHGLQVGAGLLNSISKDFALILFGDTSSKQFLKKEENKLSYTDAASAVLLKKTETKKSWYFINKTKSEYHQKIILKNGGYREAIYQSDEEPLSGLSELAPLLIDAENILLYQEDMIGKAIQNYLSHTNQRIEDFDNVFFDHNNASDFSGIREKLGVKSEQTSFNDDIHGHARGSFLPLLMESYYKGAIKPQKTSCRVLLVSFGEGLTVTVGDLYLDPSVIYPKLRTNSVYTEGFVTH